MDIILKTGVIVFRFLYSFFKLLPTQKKVTFISRQSNTASLDIRMLNDQLLRQHPDYKTVILCRKIEGNIINKISYCFHMLCQMYHLATSEIIILDSYCILASTLNHKKDLLIVQMWHSVGTMKKFGYSILDMPEGSSSKVASIMQMHANYDYILCAGEGYRSHLAEGFNYPEDKIVIFPLPRVEALKDPEYKRQCTEKIYAKYPQLRDKETIVYVPTFRKGENLQFHQAAMELADAVDYSRYNLVIKAHPHSGFTAEHPHAIIDYDFSSFDMLFVSDHVISDFSCIMYEAAVLERPLYFYTYDYDHYLSTRDIYMDYMAEVPGPVCGNADELIKAIEGNTCDPAAVEVFLNKYVNNSSNHETKDIVDFIFNNLKR